MTCMGARYDMKALFEIIRGWLYLGAFITGGNYVRKARIKELGKGVKISPTVFFKYPEMIRIGDHSFINHLCSVWASRAARLRLAAMFCWAQALASSLRITASSAAC